MLICKITQKIIHAALVVLLATLLVSVSAQVIARYFLGFSFQWSEEFPLVIFTWSAFLGAAGALADGQHVALKFVQNLFPSAIRKVIRLLVQFSILGFLIFAIVTGWDLLIL
jgi:TRAP-type C4-dicarboxylate transport system permease small subunit